MFIWLRRRLPVSRLKFRITLLTLIIHLSRAFRFIGRLSTFVWTVFPPVISGLRLMKGLPSQFVSTFILSGVLLICRLLLFRLVLMGVFRLSPLLLGSLSTRKTPICRRLAPFMRFIMILWCRRVRPLTRTLKYFRRLLPRQKCLRARGVRAWVTVITLSGPGKLVMKRGPRRPQMKRRRVRVVLVFLGVMKTQVLSWTLLFW